MESIYLRTRALKNFEEREASQNTTVDAAWMIWNGILFTSTSRKNKSVICTSLSSQQRQQQHISRAIHSLTHSLSQSYVS